MALIERDAEVAALDGAVAAACRGAGALVFVEGEAGIGKSSVLAAADSLARDADLDVRAARGHDLEDGFAFGVVLQLFGEMLAHADPAERERLLRGAARGAAPLLEGQLATPGVRDPFLILHALVWFVSNAAERRPLLLCVDDAHVADLPSLRFLHFLAQRAEDLPVLIVVAARPVSTGPTAELLTRLRSAAAPVLRPAPLSPCGVGWVMAGSGYAGADPQFVAACAEATAGNPFLLRELLFVLSQREVAGTAASAATVRDVGPRAVAEAVALALDHVGPQGLALVRALAVLLDGEAPTALVAELSGLSRAATVAAARELADMGVLASDAELRFAHPVVRTAIAAELPSFERAFLHGRAAAMLHDRGASPEQLVPHLLGAEAGDMPWATTTLLEASRHAIASGTPEVAARLLARAAREPGADRDADFLTELASAQAAVGDGAAAATIARALSLVDDPRRRAELHLQLARAHLARGRYLDATAAFRAGLDECPAEADTLAADLRSGWASAAMWLPDEGGEVLTRARDSILSVREPRSAGERVAAAQFAGSLLLRGVERATAVQLARRAWGDGAMLAAVGPQDAAAFTASAVLADADVVPEALTIAAALEHEARRQGLLLPAATAAYVRASYLMMLGDLREAAGAVEQALLAEEQGWGLYASGAHWVAARVALLRGDMEAARAAVTLDPQRERSMSEGIDFAAIPLARGLIALERGAWADAVTQLDDAARRTAAFGVCIGRYNWRPALVRARAGAGDAAGARELARENLALARAWGAPLAVGAALRALAVVDPPRRIALLQEARDALSPSGERIERTLAALDLGQALAAAQRPEDAKAVLREALELADAADAQGLVATIRPALIRLGARPRRPRTTGAAALTPAELRVARLAAGGQTNREIAEHLFVTVKAVKWHLGNTYRKLGITSRTALAAHLQTQP